MQRYFISGLAYEAGDLVRLTAEDSHHQIRVMRAEVGALVDLVDEGGTLYRATYQGVEAGLATYEICQVMADNSVELPIHVTIASGLSKQNKLEWVIQKGTELGMSAFIPLALRRDVVKWDHKKAKKRQDRFQKIAKEASEQSRRILIPSIEPLMNLKELIQAAKAYDAVLFAYEELAATDQGKNLSACLNKLQAGMKLLVIFGSEGGLDPEEVQWMEEAGFKACSLGPRILRTETAPLYLLAAVSYQWELSNH